MRVLFLDIDGVMNRTGYHPRLSEGLRSWIEPELAVRLNGVLRSTAAVIVLSSDWRVGRSADDLRAELHAAGVHGALHDVTPIQRGRPRWSEIEAWIGANDVSVDRIVIVDDGFDMGPLHARFVRTSPLTGLDEAAVSEIERLFGGRP